MAVEGVAVAAAGVAGPEPPEHDASLSGALVVLQGHGQLGHQQALADAADTAQPQHPLVRFIDDALDVLVLGLAPDDLLGVALGLLAVVVLDDLLPGSLVELEQLAKLGHESLVVGLAER